MNKRSPMMAKGFEHLHVNDMGHGCVVLWQRTVSGDREALVVDIVQLEQAMQYLKTRSPCVRFVPRAAND